MQQARVPSSLQLRCSTPFLLNLKISDTLPQRRVTSSWADPEPERVEWSLSLPPATRRGESVKGQAILLAESEKNPREAMVHYNLPQSERDLGTIAGAEERLSRALTLEKQFRLIALEGEDLKPLRELL